MAYGAVDKDGQEGLYNRKPFRTDNQGDKTAEEKTHWCPPEYRNWGIYVPKGSIEKLIGKKMTWEDEPVELKDV